MMGFEKILLKLKAVSSPRRSVALFLAILVAGATFAWWMAVRADNGMRADLRQQTRLVAQAVDRAQLQALTGTKADLDRPDYLRIKQQFSAIRGEGQFAAIRGRRA